MIRTTFITLHALVAIALCCGCDHRDVSSKPPATNPAATRPSSWKAIDPASPVAVVSPGDELKLRAAMEQARATAEKARQKWLYASADDRPRWALKWAAPVAGKSAEHVEHVWVSPMHWSPFRIEGVLASTPVKDLACGKHLGELVSFPIEELSDWVHFTTEPAAKADAAAPHEGGFTMEVLSQQYGSPK